MVSRWSDGRTQMSALVLLLTADSFFLLVLLGISAGQGVSVGQGFLHLPGQQGFASFCRGFWFLIIWALGVSALVGLMGPLVLELAVRYPQFVPAANLFALMVTSLSFGAQAGMRHRSLRVGVGFLVSGIVAAVLASLIH